MMKNRRRNYLINKEVQLRYAVLTVFCLILYTLILLAIFFGPMASILFSDAALAEKTWIAKNTLFLHNTIWPAIGLVMLLFAAYSLLATHRFVGPAFAFIKMAKNIASGNLTIRVKLRAKDDFHDLAEALNEMADGMETLLVNVENIHDRIANNHKQLVHELKERNISDEIILKIIKMMNEERGGLMTLLEKYNYRNISEVSTKHLIKYPNIYFDKAKAEKLQ